jgi:hypothetical protein
MVALKPNIMKKLLLLFCCFLISISHGNAQLWEQNYPSDTSGFGFGIAYDLIQTNDGSYVIAGELDLPTGAVRHYIQLLKTDANGNELWRKLLANYGDIRMDKVNGLHLMPDDGLLLGGSTAYNQQGLLLVRTDKNGDTLWTKTHNSNGIVTNFSKTSNYNFLSVVRTSTDLTLIKTDTLGSLLLTKTLDDFFQVIDIQATNNNDYIIAGHKNGVFHLAKINTLGDTIWTKSYQFSTGDAATTIQTLTNGDFIIGGYGTGFAGQSALIARFDGSGNLIWQNYLSIPISSNARVSDIALQSNGNYIVTGSVDKDAWFSSGSGFIAEISPNGQTIGLDTFNTATLTNGAAIITTSNNCYAIAGGGTQGYYLRFQCGTTATLPKLKEFITVQTTPNPSPSSINFSINNKMYQNYELNIFDAMGKLILTETIIQNYELKHLPSGTYFYGLFIGNQLIGKGQILFLD